MRKAILSAMMIMLTALWATAAFLKAPGKAVEARIVTVQRGDVHQVAAITGRLAYTEEQYALAEVSGMVSQICVQESQRLGADQAIIRMFSEVYDEAKAAYASGSWMPPDVPEWSSGLLSGEQLVVRAKADCTVRQILVRENMTVSAGTPVARLTSNQQQILCNVASCDVKGIAPGMWAWIYAAGEAVGKADVASVGEAAADPVTGMIYVEVCLIPEQHLDLPEEAAVDAYIYLAGSDDVLTLPVEAITARNTVWWVHDGICTEIPAQIVMTDEINAWVHLPEGIQVALGEFEEGQRIREADQ